MNAHIHSDQQLDGDFKHYVVFGDSQPPWLACDSNVVECADMASAEKLKGIIDGMAEARRQVVR